MYPKRIILSIFAVFFLVFPALASVQWKEYELLYAGKLYLPDTWRASSPPPVFKPNRSRGFWVELLAFDRNNKGIKADVVTYWLDSMRPPSSQSDWDKIASIVSSVQYKKLLKKGSFSKISDRKLTANGVTFQVVTHEILSEENKPLLRAKHFMLLHGDAIFLFKVEYPTEREEYVNIIMGDILMRWSLPFISAIWNVKHFFAIGSGIVILLLILRYLKKKFAGTLVNL